MRISVRIPRVLQERISDANAASHKYIINHFAERHATSKERTASFSRSENLLAFNIISAMNVVVFCFYFLAFFFFLYASPGLSTASLARLPARPPLPSRWLPQTGSSWRITCVVLWARLGARLGALDECAEPLVARLRGARHRGPRILTQHSRNCFASMGDVKFSPQVSFVMGSFQYTKHSDACPMRVPAGQQRGLVRRLQAHSRGRPRQHPSTGWSTLAAKN